VLLYPILILGVIYLVLVVRGYSKKFSLSFREVGIGVLNFFYIKDSYRRKVKVVNFIFIENIKFINKNLLIYLWIILSNLLIYNIVKLPKHTNL
jgi:hypothetical protein